MLVMAVCVSEHGFAGSGLTWFFFCKWQVEGYVCLVYMTWLIEGWYVRMTLMGFPWLCLKQITDKILVTHNFCCLATGTK